MIDPNAAANHESTVESESMAGQPETNAGPDAQDFNTIAKERDLYLDQLHRSRAEFANYQKRIKTQIESDRTYAVSNLATDLLNAIDNFERALDAARSAGAAPIIEGLTMVHKQMLDILAKHEIQPIEAIGRPFDPNEHEAIAQKPDPSVDAGTVVGELARGFKLRDRVLRPSRVVVSSH